MFTSFYFLLNCDQLLVFTSFYISPYDCVNKFLYVHHLILITSFYRSPDGVNKVLFDSLEYVDLTLKTNSNLTYFVQLIFK